MKKTLLSCLFALLICAAAFPQSNKLDKKLDKAVDLANSGKLSDADDYMVKLLKENPGYGNGWDLLIKIRYKEYSDAKALDGMMFNGKISVTTKDKDGNEVKSDNDSLSSALMTMLTSIKPSKKAYNKYIYTLRKALLFSDDAENSSFILRSTMIDPEVDTAVSKKALKYFNNAEEEFAKKNYEKAASYYKRALSEQPDFYKASLYLGDCYYFTGNYVEAINSFKDAVKRFPNLLEPRKYLVDAYAREKLYKNALDEAINTMLIYPDLSMNSKLEDAAYLNGKKTDLKWMPRGVFPNQATEPPKDINNYEDPDMPKATGCWVFYQDAAGRIKEFCNEKGIITKTNTLTKSGYMEVFSWEEMLKNSNDASLDEARRMEKDGYLDCYVLVTCFHYDLYPHYADFVSKNREKVIAYYNKYIIPQ